MVVEYYKHDAKFGDEMDRIQNAQNIDKKQQIINEAGEIKIIFPPQFEPKNIKGKVSLYRPSNKKLDFEIPISLSNSTLLIPKKSLVGGRWDINLNWEYNNKEYQSKNTIYIN